MEKVWPWMRPHRQVIVPIFVVGCVVGIIAGGLLLYYFVYIRVESVNSQLAAANATITTQQETIGRYEMRLGINKESLLTSYGYLSNAQLKQKAFNLVKNYWSMKYAHDIKNLDLRARHDRGEFPTDKLTEFVLGEELRVSNEYESTIHSDAILTVLELRLRIPEHDRSGILHSNLNPADPRGQKVPMDQIWPKAAFRNSEYLIQEMDLLSKLLKD